MWPFPAEIRPVGCLVGMCRPFPAEFRPVGCCAGLSFGFDLVPPSVGIFPNP